MSDRPLRVFISAAEHSGDSHGAALAKRLRKLEPDVHLEGVGGPLMRAAGVELHIDMVENAAMGLIPVLKKLPHFISAIRETTQRVLDCQADVFVPIDSPDFNLRVCKRLRKAPTKVCYYVSPQVWAWRPKRIHGIAKLVDHMMVLFPFEEALYQQVGVDCTFVGHPLFDELRTRRPSPAFRASLGLEPQTKLLGIFPGSRSHEVEHNLPLQLRAAQRVHAERPDVRFALPVAKSSLRPLVETLCARAPELDIAILDGKASDVARVARAVITVSGTATLELLHYESPMVIVYQVTAFKVWVASWLLNTKWISLVNILADREICPEYLAAGDVADDVARDVLALMRDGKARKQCLTRMRNLRKVVDPKGIHLRAAETVHRVGHEHISQGAAT